MNNSSEIIFYTSPTGETKIEVLFRKETVWMSQKRMSQLFECSIDNIGLHLKNIFLENELNENSVTEEFSATASDGKNYKTKYYSLDAIIAVGYRVNSQKATQFRIWATKTLREFIIKGFVMDDERLKNGQYFGKDYFNELLERIREIRASERRFYQKITDIYATALDYDQNDKLTKTFFATVQNKLHFAIHGYTAAEIIIQRASNKKPNMGLTTWKHAPKGKILPSDVSIAKNYLSKEEINALNRIVSMYLDYAEDQAKRKIPMTMKDWVNKLNVFLQFNQRVILKDSGKVTQKIAKTFAESEFKKFRIVQDKQFQSDFDKVTKKLLEK